MNSGRKPLKHRWRRWKHDHKRDLDFYLLCLGITLIVLMILPFVLGGTGRLPGVSGFIDSIRYVPDQAE